MDHRGSGVGMAMSGRPSWAVRGARVVCIDNSHVAATLTVGAVYTIDGPGSFADTIALVGVLDDRETDRGFLVSRFKPLITLEHDMAVHFSALLDVPASHEVDA
jgi:hypothetical protein